MTTNTNTKTRPRRATLGAEGTSGVSRISARNGCALFGGVETRHIGVSHCCAWTWRSSRTGGNDDRLIATGRLDRGREGVLLPRPGRAPTTWLATVTRLPAIARECLARRAATGRRVSMRCCDTVPHPSRDRQARTRGSAV